MKAEGDNGGFEWDPLSDLPDEVRRVYEAGYAVVPQDAERRPLIKWRDFQRRQPSEEEIASWPVRRAVTWAVVLGEAFDLIALDLDGTAGRGLKKKHRLKPNVKSRSEHGCHVWISGVPVPIKQETEVRGWAGLTLKGEGSLATFYGDTGKGSYRLLKVEPTNANALPAVLREVILDHERTEYDRRREEQGSGRDASGLSVAGVCLTRVLTAIEQGREGYRHRNESGFALFCQMRDNRVPEDTARVFLTAWVAAANRAMPKDGDPYTVADAEASLEQAYGEAPRDPSVLAAGGDAVDELDPEVRDAVRRERVRQFARQVVVDERAAARLTVPDPPTLKEALAENDPPLVFTVDEFHHEGDNTLIVAQAKAGKTTLSGPNLARSLVDGRTFLDAYGVRDIAGKVLFANYEVSHRQFKGWLADANIENPDRLVPWSLRGHRLPLTTKVGEDAAVEVLKRNEVEVWIIDPFGRAITHCELNENENPDVGRFTDTLDAIKERAGVKDLFLIAHTGHEGERARGGSVLLGWPDNVWTLGIESGTRFLSAMGRDVEVPEQALEYDPATRLLSVAGGNRKEERLERGVLGVLRALKERPGLTTARLMAAFEGDTNKKPDYIDEAVARGFVRRDPDPPVKRKACHHDLTDKGEKFLASKGGR